MKTRAAVLHQVGSPLEIEQVELRAPGQGEVLVEMKATGLCHTDQSIMDGHMGAKLPIILGHEGAGVVVDVGPGVKSVKAGDHVMPYTIPHCGQCRLCLSKKTNLCFEAFTFAAYKSSPFSLNGSPVYYFTNLGTFANHSVIREWNLVKIRNDAPLDQMCVASCGVATGLGAAVYACKVEKGTSVVVFGLGGIGLSAIQGARMMGATTIIGVDTNASKEAVARKLGMTHFVNPKEVEGPVSQHIVALTGGGADYAIECVGSTAVMEEAYNSVTIGWGTCCIVGAAPDKSVMTLASGAPRSGRRLIGSTMGDMKGYPELVTLVDWVMEGKVDLASMISHRLPLEQINHGYDMLRKGESLRSVVVY